MSEFPESSTRVNHPGTTHLVNDGSVLRRRLALVCLLALIVVSRFSSHLAAQTSTHLTFATPEEAVQALVDAAKKGNLDGLLAIFGPDGGELLGSSDPATARMNRDVFTVAAAERTSLVDDGANRKTLVVGHEDWPFPVPLVKASGRWQFDTAAGKEEVLSRRIGRNELETIETCRAYATAQRRYALQSHDGKPAGLYAPVFQSDPGKENGLYWPAGRGQQKSPLGDLVAQAAEEGRPVGTDRTARSPYHGYYFKILTEQGSAAPGGAKKFVVDGAMSGGFALVTWPAQYDVTGVMTFIVGQDGIVHQKDLGSGTDATARQMTAYNPDASWQRVQ
jgi:hypothetical protein